MELYHPDRAKYPYHPELHVCSTSDMHPSRRDAATFRDSTDPDSRYWADVPLNGREFGEDFDDYMESDEWRAYRERVLARHGGACATCPRDATHCHHRTFARLGYERDDDCVGLCASCHDALDAARRSRPRPVRRRRVAA